MLKIDEILSLTKELHKYSIINEDSYYSDKLLQIIINLSTLGEIKLVEGNSLNYQDEISKVKRKVPKWMKKTHQYNYLILKEFMDLSDNNTHRVGVDELEKHVDIGQAFLANFNNLKTISEKNHGKIFDEIDREVELWKPVAEFIEEVFLEEDNRHNTFKYLFNGKIYQKNKKSGNSLAYLLFDIFKQYLQDNTSENFSAIESKFNPLHYNFSKSNSRKKVILNEYAYKQWYSEAIDDTIRDSRYFEPIEYRQEKIYFTTQWGNTYSDITKFISFANTTLGYDIKEVA